MIWNIFVVNPGSTSTKLGLFSDLECQAEITIRHNPAEIAGCASLADQMPLRMSVVQEFLQRAIAKTSLQGLHDIHAFVGRGGLIGPVRSGTWEVGPQMLHVLKQNRFGCHASNLGALIVWEFACMTQRPAWVVDPPSTDEMSEIARITGLPSIRRKSVFHALNQKAVARMAAVQLGRDYNDINLIVCHAGGGISVGVHCKGNVIDVNNALEEGPMSPERAGSLPSLSLLDAYRSYNGSADEFSREINGRGGLFALTGTSDLVEIESNYEEKPESFLFVQAMAYQIARQIAAGSASLCGDLQAIVLTGGLAQSATLNRLIMERIGFLAPVLVYPGEKELEALAAGALRVLNNEVQAQVYIAPEPFGKHDQNL